MIKQQPLTLLFTHKADDDLIADIHKAYTNVIKQQLCIAVMKDKIYEQMILITASTTDRVFTGKAKACDHQSNS